jgi:hypothetical protein
LFEWAEKSPAIFPAIQTDLFHTTGAAGGTSGVELSARTTNLDLEMKVASRAMGNGLNSKFGPDAT